MQKVDEAVICKSQSILLNNGLIVFQSDTVLGVMARISEAAIWKADRFKNRKSGKNYTLICSDLTQLESLCKIYAKQLKIITRNVPGLFTFIVKPEKILSDELKLILSPDGKLGLRIPTSILMQTIAEKCDFPIFATSANISGRPSVYTLRDFNSQVGKKKSEIDFIIQPAAKTNVIASTVIDLTGTKPKIVRQGSGEPKL